MAGAAQVAARVDAVAARVGWLARLGLVSGAAVLDAGALLLAHRRLSALDAEARQRVLDAVAATSAGARLLDVLKVPALLAAGTVNTVPTAGPAAPGAGPAPVSAGCAAGGSAVGSTGRPAHVSAPVSAGAATDGRPGWAPARVRPAPAPPRVRPPPAPPRVRPDAELDCTPSSDWPTCATADAVVIGSGAGGAFAARTLARAGRTVVVLEEGRRFLVREFQDRPPLDRFLDLYRDGGATVALGRPPVLLPMGRGVGGTTLVNSGTCYRTPQPVLRHWRDRAGVALADPDRFGVLLDEVEATLAVAPTPPHVLGRNGMLALAGARRLGWRAEPLRRNAPGCGGCCECAAGCPRNAKNGVHLNALPQECAAGARIVSEARVLRVLVERGRAAGVLARRPDRSRFQVLAPLVVVAAGRPRHRRCCAAPVSAATRSWAATWRSTRR